MEVQQVMDRFALIAGLTSEEAAAWLPICRQATAEVEEMLRAPECAALLGDRLCTACAALTYYRYALCRACGEGVSSFQAGDVRITADQRNSVAIAQQLWREAKASLAGFVKQEDFWFKGVRL